MNHPELSIWMQAVWVFANCLSDEELEAERHQVLTQTPLIRKITDTLNLSDI